ncbi:MAG: hypothetical protein ABIR84_03735 [Candidatus Nitrotoga sp.]
MTMSLSLEAQKKIILDRIEESRRNFRINFNQRLSGTEGGAVLSANSEIFPRSHTFKILTHHPYIFGMVLFVALAVSRGKSRNFLKKNLAFNMSKLTGKLKMLVVPAIVRVFRSYIRN